MILSRWWLLSVLAACGRVGFDRELTPPAVDAFAVLDGVRDGPIADAARATYRATVLADAPISYWRLDDAGTTVADELNQAPGAYSGTCRSAAGAIANDPNTEVAFDGSSCLIGFGTGFDMAGTAPFSIEAWVATTSPSGFRQIFGHETRDAMNPIDGYALLTSPGGIELERAVSGADVKTTSAPLPTTGYVHVVGVYSGSATLVYVNGAVAQTTPDTRPLAAITTPAQAGASVAGNYYLGSLDELAVYDHALTPSRIAEHHQVGTGGP